MSYCSECAAKDAEISQLKQENARLIRAESRQWYGSPAFQTFVDLKYGVIGDVLTALRDGRITCGRAAECLAEIAHGATEVRLPDSGPTDTDP